MNSGFLFLSGIVLIILISMAFVYKSVSNARAFFESRKGSNVLGGILMVFAVAVIVVIFSPKSQSEEIKGTWLAYGELFVGIDNTREHSPQCKPDQHNDKLTSNVGFRFNIYRSADKRMEFNTKYQHHSCAYNQDDLRYDALGVEFTYKIWSR